MPGLPSGDVTFLFTDIEGSTALWDQQPQQGAFITDDLASTRTALAAALDQDEFARHFRAGARRSQNEVADLAISALLASPTVAPVADTNAADA